MIYWPSRARLSLLSDRWYWYRITFFGFKKLGITSEAKEYVYMLLRLEELYILYGEEEGKAMLLDKYKEVS